MPREIDVLQLVRSFAHRTNRDEVEYRAFADAVQRQARMADQSNPEYRDLALNPDTVLVPRLYLLAKEKKLVIETAGNEVRTITLPEHFAGVFLEEYRRMDDNPDVPFPDEDSLKVLVPSEWIQTAALETDLGAFSERKAEDRAAPLYRIVFPESVKPIVVPAAFVPDKLIEYAVLKVRQHLRRGGNKEYLYNKLLYAFTTKEILLKEAFSAVLTKPYDAIAELRKSSSDFTFPFWAYLTSHIKKDLEKKTDKTADDWSIYQACALCEFYSNYYKGKAQRILDLETAFKNLDQAIRKPPYCYTIDEVAAFKDSKGQPLLGKYSREELEAKLREKTTNGDAEGLPEYLVISTARGRKAYVAKDRLLPLAVKQIGEARPDLRTRVIEEWREALLAFKQTPPMTEDAAYRHELQDLLETRFPLLDALIKDRLLFAMYEELRVRNEASDTYDRLFYKGGLVPLDELLELPRKTLLADARMLLPIWYTVPILSSLYRFFRRLSGVDAPRKGKGKAATASAAAPAQEASQSPKPRDRKAEFAEAAARVAKTLVPSGYTMDEYIKDLEGRWNTLLNAEAKANLTIDVNNLIRDYLKSVLRSMQGSALTAERVRGLAATLADSPNLLKIRNHQALELYIQVYMVKLLRK